MRLRLQEHKGNLLKFPRTVIRKEVFSLGFFSFSKLRRSKRNGLASSSVISTTAIRGRAADSLLPATHFAAPAAAEWQLYEGLRYAVPVIDAAFRKIVRLSGGFHFTVDNDAAQSFLDQFCETVPVNASGCSMQSFADQMLDCLLLYGNAVGEMLLADEDGSLSGLRILHPAAVIMEQTAPNQCRFSMRTSDSDKPIPVRRPEQLLFTALNPPAGGLYGVSVLRGIPALSRILLRIYECIGQNYDRAGNVRYAVTYHPDGDPASLAFAKDHAEEIAAAWQDGIRAAQHGEIRDFISVGNVEIHAIGADHTMPNTEIPVRQLLEQIVSKLSIPPFLLGFSWSTTERMSSQQADILTSELEYFRRLLTPLLLKIAEAALRSQGFAEHPVICWDHINLQDETELAEARLKNAQAHEIELRNQITETEMRKDCSNV